MQTGASVATNSGLVTRDDRPPIIRDDRLPIRTTASTQAETARPVETSADAVPATNTVRDDRLPIRVPAATTATTVQTAPAQPRTSNKALVLAEEQGTDQPATPVRGPVARDDRLPVTVPSDQSK